VDLDVAEAGLSTPPGEIAAGEAEGVTELDQHVQRHHQREHVVAPGVVDEVLDDDERSPGSRC
jgi:hypothetical protein